MWSEAGWGAVFSLNLDSLPVWFSSYQGPIYEFWTLSELRLVQQCAYYVVGV